MVLTVPGEELQVFKSEVWEGGDGQSVYVCYVPLNVSAHVVLLAFRASHPAFLTANRLPDPVRRAFPCSDVGLQNITMTTPM